MANCCNGSCFASTGRYIDGLVLVCASSSFASSLFCNTPDTANCVPWHVSWLMRRVCGVQRKLASPYACVYGSRVGCDHAQSWNATASLPMNAAGPIRNSPISICQEVGEQFSCMCGSRRSTRTPLQRPDELPDACHMQVRVHALRCHNHTTTGLQLLHASLATHCKAW